MIPINVLMGKITVIESTIIGSSIAIIYFRYKHIINSRIKQIIETNAMPSIDC